MKLLALFVAATLAIVACSNRDSTDGGDAFSWSRVVDRNGELAGARSQQMLDVTVGGPGLVAVGRDESGGDVDAAVWTSIDGLSWARVAHDEGIFGGTGSQQMRGVTTGGPGLVAVGRDDTESGSDAAVWTSVDGVSWLRVVGPAAELGGDGSQEMRSVTVSDAGLVAVGLAEVGDTFDAAVWTSADGVSWARVNRDPAVLGGAGDQRMESITSGGPGLVAVGWEGLGFNFDAAVWTSPDGANWSRPVAEQGVLGGVGNQLMEGVAAGGPGIVAVGWEGSADLGLNPVVWTSSDGFEWARVPDEQGVLRAPALQQMLEVISGGPGLVAVGRDEAGTTDFNAAVWTSIDGVVWSRFSHVEETLGGQGLQQMTSVTVGGPGLVGVGVELSGGEAVAAVWMAATQN